MSNISILADKYAETLNNTYKSILGIYSNITDLENDITVIEDEVMPGLESAMTSALNTRASAYNSKYGVTFTVNTSGGYGTTNLTDWAISSGSGDSRTNYLSYYSSSSEPYYLDDFHTYETPITLDNETLLDNQQVLVHLDSSFNYNLLSMPTSGDDIRFYTNSGQECDYWIEQWNMGGDSYIWVELPKAETDSFVLRYGNDTMTAGTSGNNTFDYFADFTKGELPEGWEELTWTDNTISFTDEYTTVEKGGMYYQLPDILIQNGYQVGVRVEFEDIVTGSATINWSAMSPGCLSDKPQLRTNTNSDKQSHIRSLRYRSTDTRLYMYAGTGNAASNDAYSGSYEVSVLDNVWYTIEIGIDANGYFKRYWDHTITTLNPGQDVYYKPINYLSLSGPRDDIAGDGQDVIDTNFKYLWVRKYPDYSVEPVSTLGSTVSGNSWITNNVTLDFGDETTTVTTTAANDCYIQKSVNLDGVEFSRVEMTAKQISGSSYTGQLQFQASGVWQNGGLSDVTPSGGYSKLTWDLSSNSNWTQNIITGIRIIFTNIDVTDNNTFVFNELKITDDLNENSQFYAESFEAAYKHLNQALGTNGTYGLRALRTALITGKRIQERNRTAISNALKGYQGLS